MRFTLSAVLILMVLSLGHIAQADQLKISPEDLRMRVWVSERLSSATRSKLKHLAKFVPLPRENGLPQTDRILLTSFGSENPSKNVQILHRYYFLLARLESSQRFSAEFFRRRRLLREGITLMGEYVDTANVLAKRGIGPSHKPIEPVLVAKFPLKQVGWEGSEDKRWLRVLHRLPKLSYGLGRSNLRTLRTVAISDRDLLQGRLDDLNRAEREFLDEASVVGKELIAMRPEVSKLVRRSRAGLPFSF